ncbi:hypothetical protein [Anaeromyxobacter paludicola]|uniref:Doubled CXXCH motif domain-containing protein n=1 Tax=Anaeromyxobacter paludicola TaxID=2918171 RepID=A0ABN6N895_9BACT|nr:hypothetical protein [Anaeromyxobacter paludicola]BDG09261.1 hypothetical protein AMPC_23740 [Anaeromyxobacter paludicola]
MRSARVPVAIAAFVWFAAAAADTAVEPAPAAEPARCSLLVAGREAAAADDCLVCHELHRTHPVDFPYPYPAFSRSPSLRTPDEAVRRGVFLPDGMIRCGTCHDGASPYRYRLAIPPGAQVAPAVKVGPVTAASSRRATRATAPAPASGDVTPTPLCLSCHAYDG